MLVEVNLGQEALPYVREELAAGNTLARKLLRLPLAQGEIKTWLPVEVVTAVAHHFERGWMVDTESGGQQWARSLVHAYLSAGEGRYCMVETLYIPTDAGLCDYGLRPSFHDTEVYYLLTCRSSMQEIDGGFREARSYPFVGILTTLDGGLGRIQPGESLDASTLERLAEGTEFMLIGAYDDQGMLVWARNPGTLDPLFRAALSRAQGAFTLGNAGGDEGETKKETDA